MNLVLWAVVAACALPYVAHLGVMVARARSGPYDNVLPRVQSSALTGWGQRAWAAEQNAFEALAVFLGCALVNQLAGGDPTVSGALAVAWVGFRLGHLAFYAANLAPARSAMFGGANLCNIGLVLVAALG